MRSGDHVIWETALYVSGERANRLLVLDLRRFEAQLEKTMYNIGQAMRKTAMEYAKAMGAVNASLIKLRAENPEGIRRYPNGV